MESRLLEKEMDNRLARLGIVVETRYVRVAKEL